jgi:transcriptional regulator with XRE-family HTH domain/tetratricopeptide (TPR) repeat protein
MLSVYESTGALDRRFTRQRSEVTHAMDNHEHRAFGDLLRSFRIAAGLSQEELAERSGMSVGAISALERGFRRWPYRHTVARLAARLDLSPQERAQFETAASKRPSRKQANEASPDVSGASSAHPVRHARAGVGAVPVLIGRAREWAWLRHELAGGSPLLLLTGEPGIGKSRLLREAMGWARKQGWRVLWGGCQRSSGQEPYAPLVEALERDAHGLPPERLRRSLEGCEWLARLLPELANTDDFLIAPPDLPSPQEQRLMFAAVERYLSNITGRAGTLLVLDDLQWAGDDALNLLNRLIRSTRMGRLRILGAFRSTEVSPGHPLSTLMADLAREELVSQVELTPLEPRDALALASAVLKEEGIQRASRVVQRAGGLPFFLVNCARWAQAFGEVNEQRESGESTARTSDARAWMGDSLRADPQRMEDVPWNVTQSIRERVAALPASAQELLGVAAVVGQRASGAVLAAGAEQSEVETLSGLEVACQAGLLTEEPERDRPERYRFSHDLIRDVVEASLGVGRQTLLHRRVAVALEQRLQHSGEAGHLNDRVLSQVAYHYARADVPQRAALYLRQAGDHARHVYAHRDAAQYYQELVTCLDRLGTSREAAQARKDLAVELARVGRFSEAVAPLEQAEQISRALGDAETLALVTMASGQLHTALGTSEVGLARMQPLVEAYSAEAAGTGSAAPSAVSATVTAQLHGALSGLFFMAGHYRDALQAAERAVDSAWVTGDVGLLARERLQLGVALFTLGRLAEATEQLEDAIEGAEAVGDLETLAEALRMASWVYQTRGAFTQSQVAQARGIAVAQQLGDVVGLGHTLFFDALLAFYLGEWDRARAIGENSLAVFRQLGLTHLSAYPPLGLGWLCTIEEDPDTGEQYLAEAEGIAEKSGPAQVLRFIAALRAECALLAGQPQVANARLLPWFTGEPMQERTRLELSVLRAWAAVELGEEADADALVADTVQSARACDMRLILPDALRVQALWAIRRRRWEEAERAVNEAVSVAHEIRYPYAEAKALYVSGQMWAAKDEPARARACFEEALGICRQLGERLYGDTIKRSLAAANAVAQASEKERGQRRMTPAEQIAQPEAENGEGAPA